MAFAVEILDYANKGDANQVRGSYTNTGGDTGGVIRTGLRFVREFYFCVAGSAPENFPVIDISTLNANSPYLSDEEGNVTIITDPNSVGKWTAIGFE